MLPQTNNQQVQFLAPTFEIWLRKKVRDNTSYDQMVREMLAADELYPNDLDRLRATGFLARQYFKFNRNTWLENAASLLSSRESSRKCLAPLSINSSNRRPASGNGLRKCTPDARPRSILGLAAIN
jgi:hypothetical protein